ncbi:hypothetical protein EDC14_103746 [Hydrogenispora ethanolica]|jgi:nitrogen fixation/metabolism regulation signal transduction histidine kinase|uniref:Uncharacterized protein n=1 Tax=Hydrogenispora ethanolica TaxID=1082276 RepID=A0A4R1R345_HYDET|nr:hypothetical protein [Hydrogenispora ethanolica]TCL59809.1 hypothetical protein EDC14_103746 [Hydrogenispora ethanolica]
MADSMVEMERMIISFMENIMRWVERWQEFKRKPGLKFLKALLNSLI